MIGSLDLDGYDLTKTGYSEPELKSILAQVTVTPDDFGQEFSLPDRQTVLTHTMNVTLHKQQIALIHAALAQAENEGLGETYGNTDKNGNALSKVVREWLEQNTSSSENDGL